MRRLLGNDGKKQWILLLVWVVVNLIGIVVGTLVEFVLYSKLEINRYVSPSSWARLLGSLALCGGVQGIIVGGLQAVVLAWTRLGVRFWVAATVTAMALGMVLPMALAIVTRPALSMAEAFDRYVMGGWILAWVLAGLFQGAIAGQNRNQIIRWGLANAKAGLCWGVASVVGLQMLAAVLDYSEIQRSILVGVVSLVLGGLVLGGFLNACILLDLIRQRHQQLKRRL